MPPLPFIVKREVELTHMPRVQSENTGQNVDTVRRNERNDDISEDPITKERAGRDGTLVLYILDTSYRKENLTCQLEPHFHIRKAQIQTHRLTSSEEHVHGEDGETDHRGGIAYNRTACVST